MREHLEAYRRQTGKVHPQILDAPRLPDGCEYLWRDFLNLHRSRGHSGFGASGISHSDIDAFQRVEKVELPAWQIRAIFAADAAYLDVQAESTKAKRK